VAVYKWLFPEARCPYLYCSYCSGRPAPNMDVTSIVADHANTTTIRVPSLCRPRALHYPVQTWTNCPEAEVRMRKEKLPPDTGGNPFEARANRAAASATTLQALPPTLASSEVASKTRLPGLSRGRATW